MIEFPTKDQTQHMSLEELRSWVKWVKLALKALFAK